MIQALKLTQGMIQRRDDMRRLLGDSYQINSDIARPILRSAAKDWKLPLAEAALRMAKRMSENGDDPSMVIAAFVDECEAEHAK